MGSGHDERDAAERQVAPTASNAWHAEGVPRRLGPGNAVRVLGAVGAVGAAYVAHTSAGASAPSLLLVLVVVVLLAALAVAAPTRLRGPRTQIAAAALLQPVLHGLFGVAPHHVAAGMHGSMSMAGPDALMLLTHVGAAAAAAWWLTRGADRAVALVSSASAAAVQGALRWWRATLVVLAASADAPQLLRPADVLPVGPADALPRAVRRRGPPAPQLVGV